MRGLRLAEPGQHLSVLCLGAHSDDIEIGAGGAILQWKAAGVDLDVTWCVLSAAGPREGEARASAADFLVGVNRARVEVHKFRDGFCPTGKPSCRGSAERGPIECQEIVSLRAWKASAYRPGARHSMARRRASPRKVSSSNQCLERWLPK